MLNEREAALVADMGVYGCWLIKHGKKVILYHTKAQELFNAYAMYRHRAENGARAVLMNVIDDFIVENGFEPLKKTYPEALEDLHDQKGTDGSTSSRSDEKTELPHTE